MTFVGEIQNGQVVFPNPIPLVNGTRVRVQPDEVAQAPSEVRSSKSPSEDVLAAFEELQSRNTLGGLNLRDLIEEGRS